MHGRIWLLGAAGLLVVLASPLAWIYKGESLMDAVRSNQHSPAAGRRPAVAIGSAHRAPSSAVRTANVGTQAMRISKATACTVFPPRRSDLAAAVSPGLRKLAQYEDTCQGAVADTASFFAPTPATVSEARQYAQDMATRLQEYARYRVAPLVFFEPNDERGVLDLRQYRAGEYDAALEEYFSDLKRAGITDAMMGTWVMFPENNLPEWNNVDPSIYSANVTKTAQFQKQYFPASRTAIMLDSESYPAGDSWENGAYVSLLPYVNGIPKGLIDSFGLQGFPWTPPAGEDGAEFDPAVYLQTDLAAQAAAALGVHMIWLNTGTFREAYAQDPARRVTPAAALRQAMLDGVLTQAKALKASGFQVAVHLFAQNKAQAAEGIDWSYWQSRPNDEADTSVFTNFAYELHAADIPLWLFDSYDQ